MSAVDGPRLVAKLVEHHRVNGDACVTIDDPRELAEFFFVTGIVAMWDAGIDEHGRPDGAYDGMARLLAEFRAAHCPERKRRSIPPRVRKTVMERDAYRCRRCAGWENLQLDHIIPHSRGGSDDESNLQTLCGPCNREKGATQ